MNVTVTYCVCVRYSLVHSVNSLLWLTTPKLPGSRSSAVRKNCRRLPNRERNTTENSVTCSVRGLLLIQAHLWKINGSWQPTSWGMVSFCGSCSNKNPTTRVPAYRCGTDRSSWLDGAHPSVAWQDGKCVHCKYLPLSPYKPLEKFSKALYGTKGGTYSARIFRPLMRWWGSQKGLL